MIVVIDMKLLYVLSVVIVILLNVMLKYRSVVMVFVEFRLMMYDILWCVNWLLVNVVVNMLNIIVVCVLIIELRLIVINVVIDDVECGR